MQILFVLVWYLTKENSIFFSDLAEVVLHRNEYVNNKCRILFPQFRKSWTFCCYCCCSFSYQFAVMFSSDWVFFSFNFIAFKLSEKRILRTKRRNSRSLSLAQVLHIFFYHSFSTIFTHIFHYYYFFSSVFLSLFIRIDILLHRVVILVPDRMYIFSVFR